MKISTMLLTRINSSHITIPGLMVVCKSSTCAALNFFLLSDFVKLAFLLCTLLSLGLAEFLFAFDVLGLVVLIGE